MNVLVTEYTKCPGKPWVREQSVATLKEMRRGIPKLDLKHPIATYDFMGYEGIILIRRVTA